jgi:Xaa-Pro aminopeptidase
VFDYAERRARLSERMRAGRVDLLFLGLSADLEYLTGIRRGVPFFGQSSYAHGWVTGAFFRPDELPTFVLPRMVAAFDLEQEVEGEVVVVNETDDGPAIFERVVRGLGRAETVAIGDRAWAEPTINRARLAGLVAMRPGSALVNELRRVKTREELEAMRRACRAVTQAMSAVAPSVVPGVTMNELREEVELELRRAGSMTPSVPTHIFPGTYAGTEPGDLTSGTETGDDPLPEGRTVLFDFGGVVDGYCSDFGRTVYCGEPPAEVERAYAAMLAAQEAGRAAATPGKLAREVNAACRAPIEEAGLGEHFRHRMGHAIGLDVHERPFVSPEDETPLEAGMTFTDEPSVIVPGAYGVRIEDIVVCEEGGGRYLEEYPKELVANG